MDEMRDGAGQPISEGDSGYVAGHGAGTRPSMYAAPFTVVRVQRSRVLVDLSHPEGVRQPAWKPGQYALDPRTLCVTQTKEARQELWNARARALLGKAIREMERIDVLDLVSGATACLLIAVGELDPSEMDGYEFLLGEED